MKLSNEFEVLYLECLEKEYPFIVKKLKMPFLKENHITIYAEEPSSIGKFFLQSQYDTEFTLEQRMINVTLDGDNMDVEFFESKLKNGKIGHFEFDFLMYPRNKIFYILDKVIEPMIQTGDIGKILDSNGEGTKIIYIKNLDVVLNSLSDDKVEKKLLSWLERYVETTRFLFTFYNYNGNITSKIINYCNTLRVPRLLNRDDCIKEIVTVWLKKNINENACMEEERNIISFLSFRCYLRYLVNNEYYDTFYTMMNDIIKEKAVKNRYNIIRTFLIGWLQSGKNYRELMNELNYYIGNIQDDKIRDTFIEEIARRSTGLENSKKIMYHLENILSIFIE